MSFGGSGLRYTVNSKGRRTATASVPGTGVSVRQVSGTRRNAPRQHVSESLPLQNVVATQAVPRPALFAPKGEKRLYGILAASDPGEARRAAQCEHVAEKFPEQRIAAATLAGLFALTANPSLAVRALGYVADSGVEIADDPFLRRYGPIKGYAMDAGGGLKEFVPFSRTVVIMWLATVHLVAGDLERAEATAAELKDAPVVNELRRKIAAARRDRGEKAGNPQTMTSERSKQVELLKRARSAIADVIQSRERIRTQMAGLEQMLAKLESQASRARQLGREDLVHVALSQLNSARGQLADLASQLHQLLAEEAKLASVTQMLQAKIDA
jgi:hypothetical protein